MQVRKSRLLVCGFLPCLLLAMSQAQESATPSAPNAIVSGTSASAAESPVKKKDPFIPCPGSFPTDLTTVNNCDFTVGKRMENFVAGSLTDQAMAGSAFFGLIAQGTKSPGYWHRTWEGYGRRVGVRYNQGVAKGSAQFLAGWILHDDPRHVSYHDDPRHYAKYINAPDATASDDKPVSHLGWKRTWHAVFDSITVRASSADGLGRRMPAFSRFAADFGSAYGGYAWYRGPDNRFDKAGMRAASSFGSELASSFYTEFKPDISKVLGAMFKRGGTSNSKETNK